MRKITKRDARAHAAIAKRARDSEVARVAAIWSASIGRALLRGETTYPEPVALRGDA